MRHPPGNVTFWDVSCRRCSLLLATELVPFQSPCGYDTGKARMVIEFTTAALDGCWIWLMRSYG